MNEITIINHTNYDNLTSLLPKLNKLDTSFVFKIKQPSSKLLYNSSFGEITDSLAALNKAKIEYCTNKFVIILLDFQLSHAILINNNIAVLSIFSPVDELIFSDTALKMFSISHIMFKHKESFQLNDVSLLNNPTAMQHHLASSNNHEAARLYISQSMNIDTGEFFIEKRAALITHGFNTHAQWAEAAKLQLKNEYGIESTVKRLGFVTMFMFLIPMTRNKYADALIAAITTLKKEYPEHKISIIAHSYGTLIITKALEKATKLKINLDIDRIIFNGSIVKQNYKWDDFLNKTESGVNINHILNVCGDRDILPVLSRLFVLGTGYSGAYFFSENSSRIINIRLKKTGHSKMLIENKHRSIWGKFICNNELHISEAVSPHWSLDILHFFTKYFSAKIIYWMSLISFVLFCIIQLN